ncbi:hypothetical protein CYMTET_13235, partial [Cymbomonas tetramitiformis]
MGSDHATSSEKEEPSSLSLESDACETLDSELEGGFDAEEFGAIVKAAGDIGALVKAGKSNRLGGSSTAIWVETVDGEIEEVEREVALLSPLVQREVLRYGNGTSRESPVVLPKQVGPDVLKLILEYCRFHRAPGRSDK